MYETHDLYIISILFLYLVSDGRYFILTSDHVIYLFAFVCERSGRAPLGSSADRVPDATMTYCTLYTSNAVEYMNVISFSSPTTKQKVYMARFWLPLYSAVIMSMYASGIILLAVQ